MNCTSSGDAYYPAHPKDESDKDYRLRFEETVEDSMNTQMATNRFVFKTVTDYDLLNSFVQPTGQVSPVTHHIPPNEDMESDSKL